MDTQQYSWTLIDETCPDQIENVGKNSGFYYGQYSVDKAQSKPQWEYSKLNQLIFNFKKPKSSGGQWYKQDAIERLSVVLSDFVTQNFIDTTSIALVPMPTSKMKQHPAYDDRLMQVCQKASERSKALCLELLHTSTNHQAAHTGQRLGVHELEKVIAVDSSISLPDCIKYVLVVDDVITTGAHFALAKKLLSAYLPHITVLGAFFGLSRYVEDE